MAAITKAVALCNNEVAYIAGLRMIRVVSVSTFVRIYPATGERKALATWVPFKGQDNQGWKE